METKRTTTSLIESPRPERRVDTAELPVELAVDGEALEYLTPGEAVRLGERLRELGREAEWV